VDGKPLLFCVDCQGYIEDPVELVDVDELRALMGMTKLPLDNP
jgi:hypothetical protein